jgi:DNA polymerase-1
MYKKAVTTYGKKWLEKNLEPDGRVYANYHVCGAETGRTSCSRPNMQQIPARKLPQYRERFIASPDSVIMVSDVVQQEPCILAYESQDQELLRAIRAGEDLHQTVADAIGQSRIVGKTVNLGTSYGLSTYGLAIRLGITEQEAAKFLASYFARFSGVHRWISRQREFAYNNRYVSTAAGRRIYVNVYDNQWQNNAINAPIQGGAADCTKAWIREMWVQCRKSDIPWSMVAIVHDELVFDVPKKHVKETQTILNDSFQTVTKKMFPGVPFRIETEIGRSWACKTLSSELVDLEDEND